MRLIIILLSGLIISNAYAVTEEEETHAKETGKKIIESIAAYCKSLDLSPDETMDCIRVKLDQTIEKLEKEKEQKALGN